MFFDRDQNARRQRQIAYRNELKQQIDLKNSKIYQNQQRSTTNQPQTFSLLKNIQIEEQNRKKRQQNFYSDLQKQIQFQASQKKRLKSERIQKQLEEEQKVRKQQEILRQRAQMERIKEQNKKAPPRNETYLNNNKLSSENSKTKANTTNMQNSNSALPANTKRSESESNPNNNLNKNYYSRLKTSQSQRMQNQLPLQTLQSTNENKPAFSGLPTYVNRVENQPFNFLPQKKYMDTYFQQLLGQKRRFQQEASSISQLNKILYQERSRAGKIQSRGLGELKKLQAMLDDKGANYMAGYSSKFHSSPSLNEFDSLRKLTIPSFESSRVSSDNSGWRKLD